MSPLIIFGGISKDRFYLLKSYLLDMSVMCFLIFVMTKFQWANKFSGSLELALMIVPLAIINGLLTASFLHNTSHSNIQNSVLNRVVGEYCGFWVLYGFSNFLMIHKLHHRYPDQDLDPVNPKGMNFVVFLFAPMRYMIKATKKYLRMKHGHNSDYEKIMLAQSVVFHLNLALRLGLWYLLLGKFLFLTFYLPGFMSIVAIFAHINFVCHQEKEDKTIEIMNLDHNLYYKFANFFTMGGYYHKNHHKNERSFNPKYLKFEKSVRSSHGKLVLQASHSLASN